MKFPFFNLVVLPMAGWMAASSLAQEPATETKTIEFASGDGVEITADLYWAHDDKATPFIVLCHQAGWSRGEYLEIAPKLNEMGFNCLAIDQRSGGAVNEVSNQTAKAAKATGKKTTFVDAEQDMVAALRYARENFAEGDLVLWGSSYSAALALRIAGEHADLLNGVLAFAPGEYFARFGQSEDWITVSAKKIAVPTFVTSAKNEYGRWKGIFDAIELESKTKFVPQTAGNHGSRALWEQFDDHEDYWTAVNSFLTQFAD